MAIEALQDNPLPLFKAADERERDIQGELTELPTILKPMSAGREVVEDYSHVGLSLRQHPLSFLRPQLQDKQMVTCARANSLCNNHVIQTAGLLLVRQKPGSAKGVM